MPDDQSSDPPQSVEEARQRDWPDTSVVAWQVLNEARPGDLVLFADRSVALEVTDQWVDDDGLAHLEVEGPQGATYQVHERYGPHDNPKFSSDIGRATDLRWVERQPLPRGLTEPEFDSLIETLTDQAIDAYLRLDYSDFYTAADDVVDEWVESVAYHQWPGYDRDEWEEGDAEAIYRSILEHSGRFPEVGTPHQDIEQSPRNQAAHVLTDLVAENGRSEAHAQLVHDLSSYNDLVNRLAQSAIERYERKSYPSARNAVRDTVSNFIDEHDIRVYQSVLDHAPRPVENDGLYEEDSPEALTREQAFDTLDRDVWDTVSAIQRNRNEHDPTVRGLTRQQYPELVDALVEETLARHRAGNNAFLRTTVREVIEDWADDVEAHAWDGHRHRVWAAGDPDDIFASVVMHGDADPISLNPFASDAERRMAVQVLQADVTKRADRVIDETDPESDPIPADEYLQDELGIDMTYAELQNEDPDSVEEFLQNVVEGLEGDEMGWTFVDELVAAGGRVPHLTNEWVLVDYGIVREGQKPRRLAWFHRETGDVLIMTGAADAPPESEEWGYEDFQVIRLEYMSDDGPNFLQTDATVGEALRFVYDYVDADNTDMKIIESPNGDKWVIDAIEESDINTGGVLDALVPNFSLPGPNLTETDLFTVAESRIRGMAKFTRRWSLEVKAMAAFGVLSLLPYRASKFLTNVRVEPNISKSHGVGLEFSYEYGADSDDEGIGGKIEGDVNVRKATLSRWGETLTPEKVHELGQTPTYQTISEGIDAKRRITRRWREIAYPFDQEMLKVEEDELTGALDNNMNRLHEEVANLRAGSYDSDVGIVGYDELRRAVGRNETGWTDFLVLREYMYQEDIDPSEAYTRADYWNTFWEKFDETPDWSWSKEAASALGWLSSNDDDWSSLTPLEILREGGQDYRNEQFWREVAADVYDKAPAEVTAEDIEDIQGWDDENIRQRIGSAHLGELLAEEGMTTDEYKQRLADEYDIDSEETTDPQVLSDIVGAQERARLEDEYQPVTGDDEEPPDLSWEDIESENVPLGNIFLRGLNVETVLSEGSKRLPTNDWSFFGSRFFNPDEEPPSFREWQQRRYGPDRTVEGERPPEEVQRARYAREIDEQFEEVPDPADVMGTRQAADEQAFGQMHEDADKLGDYYMGGEQASEYASEFGNSFEDVAQKFNRDGLDQTQADWGALPGNPPLSTSDDMQPAAEPAEEDDDEE